MEKKQNQFGAGGLGDIMSEDVLQINFRWIARQSSNLIEAKVLLFDLVLQFQLG